MPEYLRITYNRMPKLEAAGHAYFITWRLQNQGVSLTAQERSTIAETLEFMHGKRYRLLSYVIMDDHVHVVMWPIEPWTRSQILHTWKSFSAHAINKLRCSSGAVFQKDSFARVTRDEKEFYQKMEYVLGNPAKRWPGLAGYEWVRVFPFEW